MLTYFLLYGAFTLGWFLRSLIALRDIRELEELRAAQASQREAEVALLNRMAAK